MNHTMILAALATVLLTGNAIAKQEKQVTRTIWEISDFPQLAEKAKAICDSHAKKSDKLSAICATGAWPSVTKAGAFRNTGAGAELNTLMRQ